MRVFLARMVLLIISIILAIQLWIFGSLYWWRTHPVDTTMFMRLNYYGTQIDTIKHEWKDYDQISDHMKRAVIMAEDGKFIYHEGFDWDGIAHALKRNEKKGDVVAGGSTISQQLAKNLFLYNKRSYIRKGQEAVATWMMERMWSKRRILEVYLNSVEFGKGIFGVEAAARHYYGRSAANLNREQAAHLAAMLPNPKYYQNQPNDRLLQKRKRTILRYMNSAHLPKNE